MFDLTLLITQIGLIVLTVRLVGVLFRKIKQPQVVGEMIVGILFGPSFLGLVAPGVMAALFPPTSLDFMNAFGSVGLLVFMFLVGLELDVKLLRAQSHTAVLTSHVSIVAPFLLGTLLALYLYPRLSDESVTFNGFALFMGAAMSITAFPVLARILTERNMLGSKIGSVAITCAAVDDVTAWVMLAFIIVLIRAGGGHGSLLLNIALIGAYVVLMVTVVRHLLRYLGDAYDRRGKFTHNTLAVALLLMLASAWTTEWLGVHMLFGAFLAGAVMPKDRAFVRDLTNKLESLTVILFLPLFFASTGLRTRIGLVNGAEMWLYCALIIAVAIIGKFGGSMISARLTGMPWREAGALGILMNTRGLMELVILNIGFDIGVISPALFSMMVLMAIVTTFMTAPLLEMVYPTRLMERETVICEKQVA